MRTSSTSPQCVTNLSKNIHQKWSGRLDLNQREPAPKAGGLNRTTLRPEIQRAGSFDPARVESYRCRYSTRVGLRSADPWYCRQWPLASFSLLRVVVSVSSEIQYVVSKSSCQQTCGIYFCSPVHRLMGDSNPHFGHTANLRPVSAGYGGLFFLSAAVPALVRPRFPSTRTANPSATSADGIYSGMGTTSPAATRDSK